MGRDFREDLFIIFNELISFLFCFDIPAKAGQDHDVLSRFLEATRQRHLGNTL